MLGGEDDVFGAGIVKNFGHRVGIPLLNFPVEGRGEIVHSLPGSQKWPKIRLLLVLPPLYIPTPAVYKALRLSS